MKYSCSECLGHVELDDVYDGSEVACPHCAATVLLTPVDVVQGAPPPVLNKVSLVGMADTDQALGDVAKALTLLSRYCTPSETVLRVVLQSKLMSVSLVPDLIAASNRRVIVLRRGIFSCQMWDAAWIDVADIQVAESFTGATLLVRLVNGATTSLERLPKDSAREFYRFCQTVEEEMRVARYSQTLQVASAGASKVNVNIGRP